MAASEQSDWRDRRVLVTGGSGFIGRHLVGQLVGGGARVVATSHRTRIDAIEPVDSRTTDQSRGSLEWCQVDLLDQVAVGSLLNRVRPDVVLHLAGLVSGARGIEQVMPMLDANLRAMVLLMEACVGSGCERFVQAGSLEEADQVQAAPASPYAASKAAASIYARLFAAHYGLSTAVARIFMVYGPGVQDTNKLVPYVIRRLLSGQPLELADGTRPVDWIFVEDVASGLLALARGEADRAELGSGCLTTVREVVEQIIERVAPGCEALYGSLPERSYERVSRADLSINESLGWEPRVSLSQGLDLTIAWFRDAGTS